VPRKPTAAMPRPQTLSPGAGTSARRSCAVCENSFAPHSSWHVICRACIALHSRIRTALSHAKALRKRALGAL
jgi:hypothetical protein